MLEGVGCDCRMPFAWHPAPQADQDAAGLWREALILLTAFNHMESQTDMGHGEAMAGESARLARVEAKLDLALYLLARTLAPADPPPSRDVWLSPALLRWKDSQPPQAGQPLVLEFVPSSTLPLALRLPAQALAAEAGEGQARLLAMPEPLQDALHQLVFRRHRQAIRDRHLAPHTADSPPPSPGSP
ncbi:MAG: PilZ domain-containing protein [Pseudomonadota bacterium]